MANKNVTLGETSANQMSYLATTAVQELPIKDNNKDNTSDLEKSLGDQISEVSSLATTSLQSLSLPLLQLSGTDSPAAQAAQGSRLFLFHRNS